MAVVSAGEIPDLGPCCTWRFTGLAGFFLSPILMRFTTGTIGMAFILTAGMFVAMSVAGNDHEEGPV